MARRKYPVRRAADQTTLTISLSKELKAALNKVAEDNRRNTSNLVTVILEREIMGRRLGVF